MAADTDRISSFSTNLSATAAPDDDNTRCYFYVTGSAAPVDASQPARLDVIDSDKRHFICRLRETTRQSVHVRSNFAGSFGSFTAAWGISLDVLRIEPATVFESCVLDTVNQLAGYIWRAKNARTFKMQCFPDIFLAAPSNNHFQNVYTKTSVKQTSVSLKNHDCEKGNRIHSENIPN